MRFCRVTIPWSAQTHVKVAGNYPLPYWGLQLSGTFQILPGAPYGANRVYTSAQVAPSLGRPLSAATVTVPLAPPYTFFDPRLNQFDVRLTKAVSIQGLRVQLQGDVYNLTNSSAVLASNGTYGAAWRRPTVLLGARLVKFGVQIDWR